MQATQRESEEIRRAREELFRELDKGIRDYEAGRLISHEECMREICEKYGLANVL